jgi:hypothetical protein
MTSRPTYEEIAAVLRPFAQAADVFDGEQRSRLFTDESFIWKQSGGDGRGISLGDARAARSLLQRLEAEERDARPHVAPPASDDDSGRAISVPDFYVILAGIRQFGIAPDRADLQDLATAYERAVSEARRSGLEEAAKVAEPISGEPAEIQAKDDETGSWDPWLAGFSSALDRIAAAIRALNPETKP